MKAALERLGFGPCYHMYEVFTHPDHVDRWLPVASDTAVNWDDVLAGYRSTQDWPASHFWQELADAYPEAKIVLTVRDPRSWYPSVRTLLTRGPATGDQEAGAAPAAMADAAAAIDRMRPVLNVIGRTHFGADWSVGDDIPDEELAVAAFHRHTARVKESIPPKRLLVFDVRQGWAPLCAFLGVPPPADEPFPHLNDSAWMRRAFEQMRSRGQLPSPFESAT
jgi:hypothetical protein